MMVVVTQRGASYNASILVVVIVMAEARS